MLVYVSSAIVVDGQRNLSLHCLVSRSVNIMEFRWCHILHNTTLRGHHELLEFSKGDSLVFSVVSTDDAGVYECSVKYGTRDNQSEWAQGFGILEVKGMATTLESSFETNKTLYM